MLYVFYGTHSQKVIDRAHKIVSGLIIKRPDAQVFSFDGSFVCGEEFDALIEARGLFVEKHVVVLRDVCVLSESRELIFSRLSQLAESQNIFVMVEGKLLADYKKKLSKHAMQIEEHNVDEEKKESFNVFSLGDALGNRNKQALWLGYVQALRRGVDAESVCGTLHWMVRALLVAAVAKSAHDAGQKDFLFNKYKRFTTNYTYNELKKLSHDLITLSHNAHRGVGNLEIGLEQWILLL